jgi:hypothetical protein
MLIGFNCRFIGYELSACVHTTAGTLDKIREVEKCGTLARLDSFNTLETRAHKEFAGVWGIGDVTAASLVNKGFRSIAELRAAVAKDPSELTK